MSSSRRHLLSLLCVLLLVVLVPSCAQGDGSTGVRYQGAGSTGGRWPAKNPFSPSSFWNRPLETSVPLSPFSSHFVAELVHQVDGYHPWMNTTSYSIPVYVVPRKQPTQHVTLDTWGPDLQQAFDHVPVPPNARAAAGTDASMTVWQPSTNRLWDFWQMRKTHGRWHARWGGEMDDVSRNPGYFTHSGKTSGWGATATGLPLLGGLVTFADLRRGYINHALAIAIPQTQLAKYTWPAQRTDGNAVAPGIWEIPEGMRFRLDPHLNIAALHLPKIDQMLARAAQRYGIVVRDRAGSVVFYGQDPVTQPVNPWPALFDNQYPNQVLAQFPWSHLQALQTQMACCW
jgi:hypothetical protein